MSLHEECGVFGEHTDVACVAYYGLYTLQHRGQESCGIVVNDDSIVRGTASGRVVKLLREAGAKEIHMRISVPPFMYPCYYGTDIDSKDNLIACKHSVEEIAEIIGSDAMGYLPVSELSVLTGNNKFCSACFNGDYSTAIPKDTRKDRFEQKLSEK